MHTHTHIIALIYTYLYISYIHIHNMKYTYIYVYVCISMKTVQVKKRFQTFLGFRSTVMLFKKSPPSNSLPTSPPVPPHFNFLGKKSIDFQWKQSILVTHHAIWSLFHITDD